MSPDASRRRLAWGLAALLLVIGAAGGMAADRLLLRDDSRGARRGPPTADEILQRMARDLDLTEAQAAAVGGIVQERQRALSGIFARVDPEAEAIRRAANDRIRALLEPAQRQRFDARVAEIEQRRAELRRRFAESRP